TGKACRSGFQRVRRVARVAPCSAAFPWGGLLPGCDIRRVSGAGAREEVGWCWDAGCAHTAHPIALCHFVRSILAASRNRRPPPPRNRPDERRVLPIGNSGTVPEAEAASAVFLRRT